MGRFRNQLLLEDKTWSTRSNIAKNDRYNNSSTQWTLVNLNFTVENYDFNLIYDQIDTSHADMCFSNITITHPVYQMDHVNCFKDFIDPIPNCRKKVLLNFLIKNDNELLSECGFLKDDIDALCDESEKFLIEQNEEDLAYIKDQKNPL